MTRFEREINGSLGDFLEEECRGGSEKGGGAGG